MERIKYEKIDYLKYLGRVNDFDNKLITKRCIGHTSYNYPLYDFIVGNGKKDLFLVGGIHGSEIIGVDFLTQLLANLDLLTDFDPNLITLHVIPLLNPEGFDITTCNFKQIKNSDFQKESYDYYLRYKIDNLVEKYLINLQRLGFSRRLNRVQVNLPILKYSFNSPEWKKIIAQDGLGSIKDFETIINELPLNTHVSLLYKIIPKCTESIISKNDNDLLKSVLKRIADFLTVNLYDYHMGARLYQEKFPNLDIKNLHNLNLGLRVNELYKKEKIVPGSHIKFDATGRFINLNNNNLNSPGLYFMRYCDKVYGLSPSSNILRYSDGPLGKPTVNAYNFQYAIENIVLNYIIEQSNKENRLLGLLLYHSTGGLIYSKPYHGAINDRYFQELSSYNNELFSVYATSTGYTDEPNVSITGNGDMLRQIYPGVLLVELSKMGGNPIGPYGDMSNIAKVMKDNINAINDVIALLNKKINKGATLILKKK